MAWKTPAGLLLIILGSTSSLFYLQEVTLASYPTVFFPLFVLYACGVGVVVRKHPRTSFLPLIVGFAVLFRLLLLNMPLVLSSDLYRYVWDGRVQRAGINPYLHPPAADALLFLRDAAIFPQINRPTAPTIYPPGAQMLFAALTSLLPDSVWGMKASMVGGDLITIGLLIRLLRQHGWDADRVLVYAWSPLVLFECTGSGHVEALMVPWVLLALVASTARQAKLTGVALGVATLIKLYPAILVPMLVQRGRSTVLWAFSVTLLGGYLPYLYGARSQILGFLPTYFSPWEDFNVGLRYFVTIGLSYVTNAARSWAMVGCLALLLGALAAQARSKMRDDMMWHVYCMISAYLLLVPSSLHPWYVVWLVPCLCFYPSWVWLYFSGVVSLSYLQYLEVPQVLPLWIRLVEFLPLYVLLALQHCWPAQRGTWALRPTARVSAQC